MTIKDLILVLASSVLLCSCELNTVYSHFEPVPIMGWEADSVLTYEVHITDTALYDLLIFVRHTEAYPYQNMWLFTQLNHTIDTLEFYLADDRGRWLGNVSGKLVEMPVLFEQGYQFPDTGTYTIRIQHGMREEALRGISDVGLKINRHGEE